MSGDDDSSASSKDWPITQEIVQDKKKNKLCSDCCFHEWQPGDTCYIVEHRHYQEHVCPACMILQRGYDMSYYRKNQKAPCNEEEIVQKVAAERNAQEALNQQADQVAELWRNQEFQAVQVLLNERIAARQKDDQAEQEKEEEKLPAKQVRDKEDKPEDAEEEQASPAKKRRTQK